MGELFIDLPEAIANTAVIAQRCAVGAPKRKPILPRLSDHEDEQLRADAHAGLELRGSPGGARKRRHATASGSTSRSTSSPAWALRATS